MKIARLWAALSILVIGVIGTSIAPNASAAVAQLPDLHPAPPYTFWTGPDDDGTHGLFGAVHFAVAGENVGDYPLDVLADQQDTTQAVANQCVAWDGRVCTARQPVGTFTFHAEHGHWHINDYARYELRHLTPRLQPDFRAKGLVAGGQKVSFCLEDTTALEVRTVETLPNFAGDPFDLTGFYKTCTGVLQGISDGWADVYDGSLPGQQIVIDGVADGDYAVVVTVNPSGRLLETNYTNNVSFQVIRLATTPDGTRTVEVLPTAGS